MWIKLKEKERDFNGWHYSLTLIFNCNFLLLLAAINHDKLGLDLEFMQGYRTSVFKERKLRIEEIKNGRECNGQ